MGKMKEIIGRDVSAVRMRNLIMEEDVVCLVQRRVMSLLFLAVLGVQLAMAQSLEGSWAGKLEVGGTGLNLVLNFTKSDDGKLSCTLDSPDQGARGIAAVVENADVENLKVVVAALNIVYTAKLVDGELKGTFTQNGFSFPLTMKPGTVEMKRPQEPKAPFPYKTEDVTIRNVADGVTLSGTLTYPEGYETMAEQSVPVVVMVTGSGAQDRDENIFGHKPFLLLADRLARKGIASLRYDDRGTGKSSGDAASATPITNYNDADAALGYVRSTGKFGKAGILGHSEGGMIAFMFGADGNPDFLVTLAAPTVRGDSLLMEQNRLMLRGGGVSEKQLADYCGMLRKCIDCVMGGGSADDVRRIAAETGGQLGQKQQGEIANTLTTPWMKSFLSYDPAGDMRWTKCPVLSLYGKADVQVPSAMNIAAMKKFLPRNKKSLTKEYDSLNHLFQHCKTGMPTEYAQIEETMSEDVLSDIISWIRNTVTTK